MPRGRCFPPAFLSARARRAAKRAEPPTAAAGIAVAAARDSDARLGPPWLTALHRGTARDWTAVRRGTGMPCGAGLECRAARDWNAVRRGTARQCNPDRARRAPRRLRTIAARPAEAVPP